MERDESWRPTPGTLVTCRQHRATTEWDGERRTYRVGAGMIMERTVVFIAQVGTQSAVIEFNGNRATVLLDSIYPLYTRITAEREIVEPLYLEDKRR